jgi:RNA polymerase sigma-70 factor (ECF subfamily)
MNAEADREQEYGSGKINRRAFYMTFADYRGSVPAPEHLVELVARVAQESDRQAFAALFRFYAPRLKSFLARQGYSENECEDLVQEAMLNVWRKAGSFDPAKAGVSTWVFTIARNLGVDHRRRQLRGAAWKQAETYEDVDPEPSAENRLIAMQGEAEIRQALSKLPDEQATVIRLSYFAENPQAEIAKTLGIPLGTVKSRVRLALQRLRQTMEDV